MVSICGYIIVRKPSENFDAEGRGAFSAHVPRIGDLAYGGIDRMRWFDVDESHYSKTAPGEIERLWSALSKSNNDESGIRVCRSIETAHELLAFSNRKENSNEIIAVSSEYLIKLKGTILADATSLLSMGYDIVLEKGWSWIESGVFTRPRSFSEFIPLLNSHGLFDRSDPFTEYVSTYERAAAREEVEPAPSPDYRPELVSVWRVILPQ